MRRLPWSGRAALALALGALFATGCDDSGGGGGSHDLTVYFVSPGEGAALGCGDDLDRDTNDTLEYNVEVLVDLKGADPTDLQARLTAEGHEDFRLTRPVDASGRVVFGNAPLPLSSGLVLRVSILEGDSDAGAGDEVASAQRTLSTAIDPADPACGEPLPPVLTFEAPTDGQVFGPADDADGRLGNGIQTAVKVRVTGVTSGNVALDVDGTAAGEAPIQDGVAQFPSVALPVGADRDVVIGASVPGTPGRSEIHVHVRVDGCTLTVMPQPSGAGCDVLAANDADPNEPGIQTQLVAQSDCDRVIFTVNGNDSSPVEVEDGRATFDVTLAEGENTVSARATAEGGLTGSVDAYVLVVDAEAPAVHLNLNELGENTFGLDSGPALPGGGFQASITGSVQGVPAGTTVFVRFNPPLPGRADDQAVVGDDGSFTLTADITEYACGRTVFVSATDDCDNNGVSASYHVCFDPVSPGVTLNDPPNGSTFGPAADADPDREGIQVHATLAIDDPRPADVDYPVYVECQVPGQVWMDRFTLAADVKHRSDADADGHVDVVVTFRNTDQGHLNCRGAAHTAPNPIAAADALDYAVLSDLPVFNLVQPAEGQCFGDGNVVVGGNGRQLTANGASLAAVVTPEGGAAGDPIPLDGVGNDTYSLAFGAEGGPAALAEGRYNVSVSGQVQGGVAVAVAPPAGVNFVVDATAPAVDLVSPADGSTLGQAEDLDHDTGTNCVQTQLHLHLADMSANRLCYTLNGNAEICQPVDANGDVQPQVDLLDGDNLLELHATDCAGHETRRQFHLNATGCPARVVIADPLDGQHVPATADTDPNTAGIQLPVRLTTGLAQGTEVVVVVHSDEQDETFGPVAVGADGSAVVPVTIDVPDAPAGPFAVTLQPRRADGGVTGPTVHVTVHFTAPTVQVPDFGACLNAQAVDAAVDPGFQIQVNATTTLIDPGTHATLTAACPGVDPAAVDGVVRDDGTVQFPPLTLPDDAACTVTAQVADAAGQTATAQAPVHVDRVAPQISFTNPVDGTEVTRALDEAPGNGLDEQGIQLTPRIHVCGAAGTTLHVDTDPALGGSDAYDLPVGDGDCQDLDLGQQTLMLGDLRLDATATDACGNTGTASSAVVVNPEASVTISLPNDQSRILAHDDLDPAAPGCQIELIAQSRGLGADAQYFVCTNVDQGAGPDACNGESSALGAAGCQVVGADDAYVSCQLNLVDGQHTLKVVGVFGQTVESFPITVQTDCTRPVVTSIAAAQDADGNACLDRMERRRPARINDRAEFDLVAHIDGVEDGRAVTLRRAPTGDRVTSALINGGVVSFPLDIDQGSYNFYVTSSDASGNALPVFGDADLVSYRVDIDTLVPRPQLLGLAANQCLNAAADEVAGQAGLQYTVRASTGGQVGEALTGQLAVDGGQAAAQAAVGDQVTFAAQSIPEGAHQLTLTVRDACGNVGSVAGFAQANGLDDWAHPLSVPVTVDTVAPHPVLGGLVNGQVLVDGDDADHDPATGFQANVSVDFAPRDGIEAGRVVSLVADAHALVTSPAVVSVPQNLAAPIPVTITLGPGDHSLTAAATDTCGNTGTSDPVAITARLSGCPSELTVAANPLVLGPHDGNPQNGGLSVPAIDGTVDTAFNSDCVGTGASLVTGPAGQEQVLAGPIAVPANGAVHFANVVLPRGPNDVRLRVTLDNRPTYSPTETLLVDLDAPVAAVTTPAAPDPAAVQNDNDANPANGLQTNVVVHVTELNVATNSARHATLEVNGQQVAQLDNLAQQSPLDVTFLDVTLSQGPATLRACVTDAAGNQGCATRQVNVDLAAPGGVDVTAEIINPRTTEVQLHFTAPADNGPVGGAVAAFEVRRSTSPIQDQAAWDVATPVGHFDNTAQVLGQGAPFAPGADVTLDLLGSTALPLHLNHFVAVRAVDAAGRLGAISSVQVDLRLHMAVFDIGAANFWPSDTGFLNQRSMIQRVGDINGDGHPDAVISGLEYNAANQEVHAVDALLTGAGDPAAYQLVPLQVPVVNGTAVASFGGYAGGVGDVDGDGLGDIAVVTVTGDFQQGATALYFGSNDPVQLATPDVVILTPARRYVTYAQGIGNFNQLAGDGATTYNDLAIGGASGGNFVNIIAGRSRAAWTASATIDASVLNQANGVTRLVVPGNANNGAGRSIAAGDMDGDGRTDVMISTGPSWGHVFWFKGGNSLPTDFTANAQTQGWGELADSCPPPPGTVSFWGSNLHGVADLDGQPGADFLVGDYNSKAIAAVSGQLQPLDCFRRSAQSYGAIMNSAGDVNDDGTTDVIASHFDPANIEAHVFYNNGHGRFGGADVNGLRTPDIVFNTLPARKIGATGLGDVNGDGFDDLGVVYKEPGGALHAVLFY
jgi:hypothetical protein